MIEYIEYMSSIKSVVYEYVLISLRLIIKLQNFRNELITTYRLEEQILVEK